MLLTSRRGLLPMTVAMLLRVELSLATMAWTSMIVLLSHHTLLTIAAVPTSIFCFSPASQLLTACAIITMASTSIFRFALCVYLVPVLSFESVTPCSVFAVAGMVMAMTMTWSVVMMEGEVLLCKVVVASSPAINSMWREVVAEPQSLILGFVGFQHYPPWG